MHLVIVSPEYPPHGGGGILKFYRTLAPRYVKAGHRVTVLVANPFSDDFPGYEHDGVVVRCVPLQAGRKQANCLAHLSPAPLLRQWLGAARAAATAAVDLSPDIVETTDFGVLFVPLLVREARPPIIVQMHGSIGQISMWEPPHAGDELDVALSRLLEASVLSSADEIQAYSPLNAAEWSRRLQRQCVFLAPPMECREPAGIQADDAALVVARIQPWKGPDLLCEAVQRLGTTAGGLKIDWVGRDTMTAPDGGSFNVHLAAKYKGIWGDAIRPTGSRMAEEVWAAQQAARFVIVPSAWDTFNLAAAEAMAARRVVICSDGAGASFLIQDRVNGFLFKAGDADSLAAALRRVLALPPAETTAIGEAAERTVSENLDPDRIACLRLERMHALVSSGGGGRVAVPDWMAGFVETAGGRSVSSDFLDNVSIRELTRHLARRLRRRLLRQPGT